MKNHTATPAPSGHDGIVERITIRSNGSNAMMSLATVEALCLAVAAGNAELVERLLPMVNKRKGSQRRAAPDPILKAFTLAAGSGAVEMLRLLVDWVDPAQNNSAALRFAAASGRLSCVEFLLPLSGPCSARGMALARAAANGHVECVAAILPTARAEANGGEALTLAVKGGWHDCVKILTAESELASSSCKAIETAARRGSAADLKVMAPHATAGQLVNAIVVAAQQGHAECALLARDLSLSAGASRRAVNQAICDAARCLAWRGDASGLQATLPFFRPPKGCFDLADLAAELREMEQSQPSWKLIGPAAEAIEVFSERKELASSLGSTAAETKRSGPRL